MWRPYLEALNRALPHVIVVIDKFHVVKQLNEIVEKVRKEIRSTLTDRQRRGLMHDRFILLKRERDLDEKERLIMESWFSAFPRLGAVHTCKEAFYHIYEATTQEDAISRYFDWIEIVKQRGVFDAFLDLLFTIENWGEFIFAYFREPYTGGFVEAANGISRVIARQGRGYSFAILRARLFLAEIVSSTWLQEMGQIWDELSCHGNLKKDRTTADMGGRESTHMASLLLRSLPTGWSPLAVKSLHLLNARPFFNCAKKG
jgi:transposase